MQTNALDAFKKSKVSVNVFFVATCGVAGLTIGLHIVATSHTSASSPTAPTISISEIMSCPSTGTKEWVELQRTQDSATQLSNTSTFSLAGYQLEDDKSIIWTGTDTIPEPGPITGGSEDAISASIGGYFEANDSYTTITFSKHYLNNTGDILKLWSPTGELLEQVTLPVCPENGKSWTFQDGDWLPASPTPGHENPSPNPIVSPLPSASPTPSPSNTANPSPSPSPSNTASPIPTAKATTSPDQTSNQSAHTNIDSQNQQTIQSASQEKLTIPQPASYIAKVNQNTSQILGTTDETSVTQQSTPSASAKVTSKPNQQTKPNPLHHDLLYSPDRSIFAYLSAILGGALLTVTASLLAYRSTQAQSDTYINNTPKPVAISL
jgi:hypothetical protein